MNDIKDSSAYCDALTSAFLKAVESPRRDPKGKYYVGVDLGTACVVTAVLDGEGRPAAGAYQYADVVRDGMVVDYMGAVDIVRNMKADLEKALDTELEYASAAIPPGTDAVDGGAVANVVRSAGYELVGLEDEPTAANRILGVTDGAVVDIGGGTTGISIFKGGKVVFVDDEPTGGTHFSLVLAGACHKTYEEAEIYKRDPTHHQEILPVLRPVAEKVASIISRHIDGRDVPVIWLVGGTSCLTGIESIIEAQTGVPAKKPAEPMFVTPLGIAYGCMAAMTHQDGAR